MQNSKDSTPLRRLLPGTLELWYIAFASCALLLAGDGRLLLEKAGLIGSTAVIHQQLSAGVTSGMDFLETFRFTASVVDFLMWGVVGLIVYSILGAIVRVLGTIERKREFDSARYVHPSTFSSGAYWRSVAADAALGFALLALFAAGALLYLLFVVPVSFAYTQEIILQVNLRHLVSLALGVFAAFAGTAVLYTLFKLVVWRHRRTATAGM